MNEIELILSKDFEEIVNSSLSLTLLKVYSKYYLNGGQPRTCRASQLTYYQRIIKDKNKLLMDNTNKTKLKGIRYIGKPFCKHFNLEDLSDKDAYSLLDKKILKESDFQKLPKEWEEDKKVEKQIKAEEKAVKKTKKSE